MATDRQWHHSYFVRLCVVCVTNQSTQSVRGSFFQEKSRSGGGGEFGTDSTGFVAMSIVMSKRRAKKGMPVTSTSSSVVCLGFGMETNAHAHQRKEVWNPQTSAPTELSPRQLALLCSFSKLADGCVDVSSSFTFSLSLFCLSVFEIFLSCVGASTRHRIRIILYCIALCPGPAFHHTNIVRCTYQPHTAQTQTNKQTTTPTSSKHAQTVVVVQKLRDLDCYRHHVAD